MEGFRLLMFKSGWCSWEEEKMREKKRGNFTTIWRQINLSDIMSLWTHHFPSRPFLSVHHLSSTFEFYFIFTPETEHTCYTGNGQEYRGTASRTETGIECGPWSLQVFYRTADYPEVIGGHNFCRNPGGRESRPWCFTNDQEMKRQLCDVPKCSKFFKLFQNIKIRLKNSKEECSLVYFCQKQFYFLLHLRDKMTPF